MYRIDIQIFTQSAENSAYFGRTTTSHGNIAKMGRNFNIYPGDSCVFLIISQYSGGQN